jgi:hypothetical protein
MEHPQSFLSNLREQTRSITALIVVWFASLSPVEALGAEESKFIDHSLMIASEYPCTWPAYPFPRFQLNHQRQIGPESNFNIDSLLIDGNTGTQLDVPPHSVARPDLNREKSGPLGLAYTDKIEAWQFGGEACVIDVRDLLDKAPPGESLASSPGLGGGGRPHGATHRAPTPPPAFSSSFRHPPEPRQLDGD